MENNNCENCKFSTEIIEDGTLARGASEIFVLCHRFPPQSMTVPTKNKKVVRTMWSWPTVGKNEWCGEFKPKDNE